ncbi:cytoglobin-2-like protein, partial [Nephila pilipes]
LFETHPDVQDVFMPFKGLSKEELRHSKELRAHGLRVMGFVQKVVARFDEPEKSEQLLRELGRNHVMYGAKMDYVDDILSDEEIGKEEESRNSDTKIVVTINLNKRRGTTEKIMLMN